MTADILQIFCAGLGTLGFALFLRVRGAHLPAATLGGVLSWTLYLLVHAAGGTGFFSTLVAALAVCLWSETMARRRKAPATIFLMPGIVPLLPGGAMYYTMDSVVLGDMDTFVVKASETLFVAVGIAGGILIASEVVRVVTRIWAKRRRRQLDVPNDPRGQ